MLTQENQAGRICEMAGDEPYTLGELANEIARQSGKAVVCQELPEGEFKAALLGSGLPDFLATLLSESDVGASKGGLLMQCCLTELANQMAAMAELATWQALGLTSQWSPAPTWSAM